MPLIVFKLFGPKTKKNLKTIALGVGGTMTWKDRAASLNACED